MEVKVNGKVKLFEGPLTLRELLLQLELQPDRCAIELNRHLVQRTNWDSAALQDGDELEIVQFVGGG